MPHNMSRQSGFTLLETSLAVALMVILLATILPIGIRLLQRNDANVAQSTIVSALRRAQFKAMGMEYDSQWGVRILPGNVTVFRGASYAARVAASDEVTPVSPAVTYTGTTEYVFTKLIGEPVVPASVTITSAGGESKTLTMNQYGTITFP